ncbi:MAG: sulfite exporter TauE/SafE family protein [Candidatus Omnitrophica bacterium]|nr:sulfite exporter TauE/SafE family protein [Candidatus Omnitrophota bacterium]
MNHELLILSITAVSIGFFHTLLGPDHYLPFIVMARARRWSLLKTGWVTFLCGIGHIMSSVLLGIIGVALGIAVTRLEILESFRGNLAAWALIAFGLVYFIWGLRQAIRNRPHAHLHDHIDEGDHVHTHVHNKEHLHIHNKEKSANLTPWVLFTIFIFGPCEPLIPILMYPAAKKSIFGLVWVAGIFAVVTIATMLGVVMISTFGINLLPMKKLERYTHAIAGGTIFICGLAIQLLGV